jgi:F-type H+-transporting ATPase subunit delta
VKDTTIARNYAEALITAAAALDRVEPFGQLMDAVAGAIATDDRIALALESPRVAKPVKIRFLAAALADVAPAEFVRFLQAVVRRGRQGLLGEISRQYQALVDLKLNRVHAAVTLAGTADAAVRQQILDRLTAVLGKDVRAHFRADPGIIGGVIVRVGDRVFDGSVRRRLTTLRRAMLGAD